MVSALERARYSKDGRADRFLGFWLNMAVEARGGGHAEVKRATRTINRFLSDTTEAFAEGPDAYFAELRDAAARFWRTTQTDPAYSSSLFGLQRLTPERLLDKVMTEATSTVALLLAANVERDTARQFPRLLVEGLLDVLPDAKQHLRVALTQRPEALEAVGYLTGE